MNKESLEVVKKIAIGKSSPLSDHRSIYCHLSLSKVQRGRGFWRLNGELLYDPSYIFGCNEVIRKTILQYSEHSKDLTDSQLPPDQVLTSAPPLISYSLLHDVILLKARAYRIKYSAKLKRELLRRTEELNDEIERNIDSDKPEEMEIVENLKEEVQNIEDGRDLAVTR